MGEPLVLILPNQSIQTNRAVIVRSGHLCNLKVHTIVFPGMVADVRFFELSKIIKNLFPSEWVSTQIIVQSSAG